MSRERNAHHEAAHVVLGMDNGRRVHRVTLTPGAAYTAVTLWEDDPPELQVWSRELWTGGHRALNGMWPQAMKHGCRWLVEVLGGDAAADIVAPRTGYQPAPTIRLPETLPTGIATADPSPRLQAAAARPRTDQRHDDDAVAGEIAYRMVALPTIGPFLNWMRAEARRACAERWPVIESVASALLAAETLDGDALEALYTPPGDAHGAK